jgi:hypothetical protein
MDKWPQENSETLKTLLPIQVTFIVFFLILAIAKLKNVRCDTQCYKWRKNNG